MNRMKNEEGYALIIVLLLIVVITLTTAVFMNASISTAKQQQIVDSNNMAVVAAEMGMDYYLNYIGNKEKNIFKELQIEISNEFICDESIKTKSCQTQIQELANKKYYTKFNRMVINILENSNIRVINTEQGDKESGDITYEIDKLIITSLIIDDFVHLEMRIRGTSPTNTEILTGAIMYKLPDIEVEVIEEEGNEGSDNSGKITDPSAVFGLFLPKNAIKENPCKSNGDGNGNADCKNDGNTYYTSDDPLYGNLNNMKNITWFHKGMLVAGNNMNNLTGKLIVESLNVEQNINNLYGNLVLVGKNDNAGQIAKSVSVKTKDDGKICINIDGYSITDLKKISIDGHLVYYSSKPDASWPGGSRSGKVEKYTSFSEFINYCTGLSPFEGGEESEKADNGKLHLIYFERDNVDVEIEVDYIKNKDD